MADKMIKEALMFECEFSDRLEKLDGAIEELEEMRENLEKLSSYKFSKCKAEKKISGRKKR